MKPKLASISALLLVIIALHPASQVFASYANVGCTPACADTDVCTALGCISTDASGGGFFASIINIAVGLGGGFALLLMLYGVFIVTTSAGIPDKLKEGREIITSAISGLIFIIMSIVLLNLIGVKILAIPGL
jgi:hypothetical protein